MTPFAPMAQNRSAPLAASPAVCRPLPARSPRRVREHPFGQYIGQRPQDSKGPRPVTPGAIAAGVFMTDRPYHGPITTAFDRRILQSPRIPYFCAQCAGSIDVPTGTELCHACLRAQKVAA